MIPTLTAWQNTGFSFFKNHKKLILEVAFGLFFVALAVYFIRQEQGEMAQVATSIQAAHTGWLFIGLILAIGFVIVQGLMYQFSFYAIHEKIRLSTGVGLFLKRNLVSVFLPAGVLTNVLFFNEGVEKKEGINRTQIYFASTIFSMCSIASTIIVGVPALFLLFLKESLSGKMVIGLVATTLLLALFSFAIYSIIKEGVVYRLVEKHAPSFHQVLQQLKNQAFSLRNFWTVVALSCLIEIIGIIHLYISIEALGAEATLEIAVVGYAIVLLLLMSSPFLRGIGAIEVALTYVLTVYGFSTATAISIAFLFRFLEFWLILVFGIFALLFQRDNVVLRILPPLLLFILGFVNIISAVLPAVPERIHSLQQILPLDAIHASTWLVLVSGIILLSLSVYLLQGLRVAWWAAIVFCCLSLVAHLGKGIDWEESIIAGFALASLIYQRDDYFLKSDWKFAKLSLFPVSVIVGAVFTFGTLGFFFLDVADFGTDFTLVQSIENTFKTFFLLDGDLHPVTSFGRQFLYGMNIIGGITLCLITYALLQPLVLGNTIVSEDELIRAKKLIEKYGESPLDYFKTYSDKFFFFPEGLESFISYKTTSTYALVLESPVAENSDIRQKAIIAFDEKARKMGKRTAYYRIPEEQKREYMAMGKRVLPIGEDATVNLETLSLAGKKKANIRSVISKLSREGYVFKVYEAPQSDSFLQQLQAVSDDWLKETNRKELVFSQGVFNDKELKNQRIFTLENETGRIVSFINQIPSYAQNYANFDLMRKTKDCPGGSMDFLFVKMFEFFKAMGYTKCNLGMVPMSGIEEPQTMQERSIKLAYEKIKHFSHFKSLRHFKEKYDPEWKMMYMAYDTAIDIIYLPSALDKVVQV